MSDNHKFFTDLESEAKVKSHLFGITVTRHLKSSWKPN